MEEREISKTVQEKKLVNTESLVHIAIYLSGLKEGKGNLLPLGINDLECLWDAIKYLQGACGYMADRDSRK